MTTRANLGIFSLPKDSPIPMVFVALNQDADRGDWKLTIRHAQTSDPDPIVFQVRHMDREKVLTAAEGAIEALLAALHQPAPGPANKPWWKWW